MKKRTTRIIDLPSSGNTPILLILSISFFLGAISGCFLVNQLVKSGESALESYLNGFLSVACSGQVIQAEFWQSLFDVIRWPLLILALGITPLGLIGVPALFLVRGFLFSFSIASLFRVLGPRGLLMAIILFGLSGIIYIPVLFQLGVQCFYSSGQVAGRLIGDKKKNPLFPKSFIHCTVICFLLLLVCASAEYLLIPQLMGTTAQFLIV